MTSRSARTTLVLMLAVMAHATSDAQAQTGEQGLLWRSGDPFVFCRHGMQHSPKAWYTISDYATSTPRPTPGYCPWPTTYCQYQRGWTMDEIFAFFTYLRICPQAERSGRWEGVGEGTQAPFSH